MVRVLYQKLKMIGDGQSTVRVGQILTPTDPSSPCLSHSPSFNKKTKTFYLPLSLSLSLSLFTLPIPFPSLSLLSLFLADVSMILVHPPLSSSSLSLIFDRLRQIPIAFDQSRDSWSLIGFRCKY